MAAATSGVTPRWRSRCAVTATDARSRASSHRWRSAVSGKWRHGHGHGDAYDHGDGAHPVLVRQGNVWGASFHPELAHDARVHGLFLDSI